MKKGDLIIFVDPTIDFQNIVGVIIKGPYGCVKKVKSTWDGKTLESKETIVVDALFKNEVLNKIPVENLSILR
jgi:hypothetical protein